MKPKIIEKFDFSDSCETYGWTEQDLRLTEEMFGNISHNLNNSLAIVSGTAFNLKTKNPESIKELNKIRSQCFKMSQYIKHLEGKISQGEDLKQGDIK